MVPVALRSCRNCIVRHYILLRTRKGTAAGQQTAIDIVQVLWYCYCRVSFPCCLPCTHAFLLRQCVAIVVVCFLLAPFDSASPIMVIPSQASYPKSQAWSLQKDTDKRQ